MSGLGAPPLPVAAAGAGDGAGAVRDDRSRRPDRVVRVRVGLPATARYRGLANACCGASPTPSQHVVLWRGHRHPWAVYFCPCQLATVASTIVWQRVR